MEEKKKAPTEVEALTKSKNSDFQSDTQEKAYISSESLAEKVLAVKQSIESAFSEESPKSYLSNIYRFDETEEDNKFLLRIGGVPSFPKGSLIALQAKKKSGKSQFQYYIISAILNGGMGNIELEYDTPIKMQVFDTEQRRGDIKVCHYRLRNTINKDPNNVPNLQVFYLRPKSREERWKIVHEAITTEKPDLVFLDGVRDLVGSINDERECADLMDNLMKLTDEVGCSIVCVIHQNKSEMDSTMRGWLGSELGNKDNEEWELKKKDGYFSARCVAGRAMNPPDVNFTIEGDCNPCSQRFVCVDVSAEEARQRQERAEEKLAADKELAKVLFPNGAIPTKTIKERYHQTTGKGDSSAEKWLKDAREAGIILEQGRGFYKLP